MESGDFVQALENGRGEAGWGGTWGVSGSGVPLVLGTEEEPGAEGDRRLHWIPLQDSWACLENSLRKESSRVQIIFSAVQTFQTASLQRKELLMLF